MQDILSQIKKIIREKLPKDAQVILYGSRARGDYREDSDWDLLILLNKKKLDQNDYDLYVWPLVQFGWDEEEYFSVKMYSTDDWEKRKGLPFYKNVKHEGVTL
ncbi:MAG: nucleotidyltransferase domain-containing protein [Bacteroidales bacterium]|nr:nucleotidyltransferase domain-containing protein [Bacteroidales bacterium]